MEYIIIRLNINKEALHLEISIIITKKGIEVKNSSHKLASQCKIRNSLP